MAMNPSSLTTNSSGRVCVLGSLNMDLIVRAPRLPGPGETLLGGEFATLPGGKGANQAVAAARAGAQVSMIGAVGDDDYGRQLLGVVGAEGINISAIRRRSVEGTWGTPTGIAVITVTPEQGENTIVVAGGANQTLSENEVLQSESLIRDSCVLLMQLESPLVAVGIAAIVAKCPNGTTTTILNAAPAQALPAVLLEQIDYLVINRSEAAVLTGLPESVDPLALLDAAVSLGPRTVVLTLGSKGALARSQDGADLRRWHVPAFDVSPVDTVAAGDAFVGTFAAALAGGRGAGGSPFGPALTLASAAGALATTRRGAIPSLPTLAEVNQLVRAQPDRHARQE
jgi:ribokinase